MSFRPLTEHEAKMLVNEMIDFIASRPPNTTTDEDVHKFLMSRGVRPNHADEVIAMTHALYDEDLENGM